MTFLGLISHFRNNSQRKNPPKLEPFWSAPEPGSFRPSVVDQLRFSSDSLNVAFYERLVIGLQDEAASREAVRQDGSLPIFDFNSTHAPRGIVRDDGILEPQATTASSIKGGGPQLARPLHLDPARGRKRSRPLSLDQRDR
jgi:hypothetical protein